MKPTSQLKFAREFPRQFGERFSEGYNNCPPGHNTVLCACGNTFHRKHWDNQKYCSKACFFRYSKDETIIMRSFKEASALAS